MSSTVVFVLLCDLGLTKVNDKPSYQIPASRTCCTMLSTKCLSGVIGPYSRDSSAKKRIDNHWNTKSRLAQFVCSHEVYSCPKGHNKHRGRLSLASWRPREVSASSTSAAPLRALLFSFPPSQLFRAIAIWLCTLNTKFYWCCTVQRQAGPSTRFIARSLRSPMPSIRPRFGTHRFSDLTRPEWPRKLLTR